MSYEFPQFQSFPTELQILVFDEFLMVSLNARIVLLDTEDRQIFAWDHSLLGWDWHVSNREQLRRESPAAAAATLAQVNTTARDVANRFLDRQVRPFNPPQAIPALTGLGLCLLHDVFWLPNDLEAFLATTIGARVHLSPTDDENISNIMISLRPFEEALRWATQPGYEFEDSVYFTQILKVNLTYVVDTFPAAWDLIVMVGIPRGHISWDQIEVVRGNDLRMILFDDETGRCQRLYQTYQALNQELMDLDPTGAYSERALPNLSFAFPKLVRNPPRLTIE